MLISKELLEKAIVNFPKWMDIRKRYANSNGGKLLSSISDTVEGIQDEIDKFIEYRANHVALVQRIGKVVFDTDLSEHDKDKIEANGEELNLFALRNSMLNGTYHPHRIDKSKLNSLTGKHVKSQKHHPEYWDDSITARNFDDERNKLYLAVIEMVKQYRPKAFIIENVPGMATLYGGQIKDEILKRFRKMGYNIDCKILCAADYGVPQIRKRLIFMGIREDLGYPKFPEPILKPEEYLTCRDAVSDLPTLENDIGEDVSEYSQEPLTDYQRKMRGDCTVLCNHLGTNHTQMVKDTIALVPEGGNYKDLPEEYRNTRKVHIAWTRLNSQKPSITIDTGHRHHFHYCYKYYKNIQFIV